ncbi:E3 ubiquitin-protein ligase TRIM31-like [Petaurus breviceps papuanus]|uniref:E3 ubiquitin-protein ligase TRIM31-like n=1 Tax=Petaurus breviceps papuanus TaxID=3040969 RepID=UPI0036DF64A3
MAARPLPENLLEEVTCSICVEHLNDPVSIPCGHSFCRVCITNLCDFYKARAQDSVSCPICKEPFQKKNISPNWVLAQLVPSLLNLELSDKQSEDSKQPADYQLCKQHGEKTFFYCETDEQFLCFVCRELREHSTHVVLPVEDAAQPYKDEIQRQLKSLKESKEKIMHLKENDTFQALLNQIQDKKLRIVSECQQFQEFLDVQKQLLLFHVEELEKDITCKKEQHATQVSQKISHLEKLINKMEEKASQTPSEILKIRKQLEERWEKEQVLTPFTKSQDLEERVCAFTEKTDALEESMRSFKAPRLQLHLQNKTTKEEICQTVEQMLYQLATEIITQSKSKDGQGIFSETDRSEILEMVVLGKLKDLSSKLRMKIKTTPLRVAVVGNASLSNPLLSTLHRLTFKTNMQSLFGFKTAFTIPFVAELQMLPDIETYRESVTTYLKEIDCDHFNVVIIVVSIYIESVHTSLAIELHNMGKKVYFISMNIQPVSASPDLWYNFGNTMLSVWNLERISISNPQVFLISVMNGVSDFEAFSMALRVFGDQRRAMAHILMDFLSNTCVDAIERKKTALQEVIGVESLMVALQVSGASGVLDELRNCLNHYRRLFGVDDLSLTNLAQMLGWDIKELQRFTKSWNFQAVVKDNQKLSFIIGRKVEVAKPLNQHSYQKLYNQAHDTHNYFLEIVTIDAIIIFQKMCLQLYLEAS